MIAAAVIEPPTATAIGLAAAILLLIAAALAAILALALTLVLALEPLRLPAAIGLALVGLPLRAIALALVDLTLRAIALRTAWVRLATKLPLREGAALRLQLPGLRLGSRLAADEGAATAELPAALHLRLGARGRRSRRRDGGPGAAAMVLAPVVGTILRLRPAGRSHERQGGQRRQRGSERLHGSVLRFVRPTRRGARVDRWAEPDASAMNSC